MAHSNTDVSLPTLAVSTLVVNPLGQVLLIERAQAPFAGDWTLPGGRVKFGESLAQAACRETQEETGLDLELGPRLDISELIEVQGAPYHYVIMTYLARPTLTSPAAQPHSDARAAMWCAAADLGGQHCTPGLRALIDLGLAEARRVGWLPHA